VVWRRGVDFDLRVEEGWRVFGKQQRRGWVPPTSSHGGMFGQEIGVVSPDEIRIVGFKFTVPPAMHLEVRNLRKRAAAAPICT
jgi:hypothetical protein